MARRMQRDAVVLPQPLSPTSPSVSPSLTVKLDIVDGAHMADDALQEALGDGEEFLQAAHVEQRLGPVGGCVAHAGSASSLMQEAARELAGRRPAAALGTAVEQRSA